MYHICGIGWREGAHTTTRIIIGIIFEKIARKLGGTLGSLKVKSRKMGKKDRKWTVLSAFLFEQHIYFSYMLVGPKISLSRAVPNSRRVNLTKQNCIFYSCKFAFLTVF